MRDNRGAAAAAWLHFVVQKTMEHIGWVVLICFLVALVWLFGIDPIQWPGVKQLQPTPKV